MKWRAWVIISIAVGAIVCWTTARNMFEPTRFHDAVRFDPFRLETVRTGASETPAVSGLLEAATTAERPEGGAWRDVPIGIRPPVRTPPRPNIRSPWKPPPQ